MQLKVERLTQATNVRANGPKRLGDKLLHLSLPLFVEPEGTSIAWIPLRATNKNPSRYGLGLESK